MHPGKLQCFGVEHKRQMGRWTPDGAGNKNRTRIVIKEYREASIGTASISWDHSSHCVKDGVEGAVVDDSSEGWEWLQASRTGDEGQGEG